MKPLPVKKWIHEWQDMAEPPNALDMWRRDAGTDGATVKTANKTDRTAAVEFTRMEGESTTRAARRLLDVWQSCTIGAERNG
jgi:hypothetical protein